MGTIAPCKLRPKHKWVFVKNITETTIKSTLRGITKSMHLRGVYRCECGLAKHGASQGGSL